MAPSFLLSRKGEGRRSLFRHVLDGLVLLHGLLPIAAIEFLDDHAPHSALIQAVWGDSWGGGTEKGVSCVRETRCSTGSWTNPHLQASRGCM